MLEYDFEQSIGFWIFMTNRALQRAMNEELKRHEITYRQMQVLGWLAYDGEQSQVELAGKMEVKPSSLVGIIERMERAGWIRRESCTDDRRRNVVRVLPGAKQAWAKIVECASRVRARATSGLSQREHEMLLQLLPRVHANLAAELVVRRPREAANKEAP
ncbi:MAG: MarR family transcriptional regulator [Planctomycetia bacterium]|nr:MarR family transcriptional regulator [Planctomycetia bacterium]